MLAMDWAPLLGGLCALFAVGITLVVVAAPWRRVREEAPLDDEVQARLLLGEDPEDIDRDLEAREEEKAPVSELRPEE
jgi:hypothetical protein